MLHWVANPTRHPSISCPARVVTITIGTSRVAAIRSNASHAIIDCCTRQRLRPHRRVEIMLDDELDDRVRIKAMRQHKSLRALGAELFAAWRNDSEPR